MFGTTAFCTYELGVLALLLLLNADMYAVAQECPRADSAPNKEAGLIEELLCNHDVNDRPVKNDNTTVNVTIDLLPIHLRVEQSPEGNFVTVTSWVLLSWKDEFLSWETKTDYSDVEALRVSSDKLWLPQVILFNSGATHPSQMHTFVTECVLEPDGEVACAPHAMNRVVCEMELSKWPYDTQNCSLVFRIWLHYETTVNLTYNFPGWDGKEQEIKISQKFYEENPYWHLEKLVVGADIELYANPGIVFTFTIRRHNSMLNAFIVGPAIAMLFMTLVSIVLETDSANRISLLGVSLFSHIMYLQQLSWVVPASGDMCPLVLLFFRDSTLVTLLVLLATSAIRHNHIWSARCLDSMTKVIYTVPGKIIMFPGFAQDDLTTIVGEEAVDTNDQIPKVTEEITQNKNQLIVKVFANRLLFLLTAITYFGLCMGLLVGFNK